MVKLGINAFFGSVKYWALRAIKRLKLRVFIILKSSDGNYQYCSTGTSRGVRMCT